MFSAQEDPKVSKIELQKTPKIKVFLDSNKTTESCSRLHAELVFEVWRTPKPHFFRDHFRKPSSCCTGAVVSQIFVENDAPESVQNPSKILSKMKQETRWKKYVKSGGGSPRNMRRRHGRSTSGSVVILHFAVLEEVIPWVSLHFSIFSVGAPP